MSIFGKEFMDSRKPLFYDFLILQRKMPSKLCLLGLKLNKMFDKTLNISLEISQRNDSAGLFLFIFNLHYFCLINNRYIILIYQQSAMGKKYNNPKLMKSNNNPK